VITLTNLGVQNASNIFVPNGSIRFQLNVDASVIASPYGFVAADVPVTFQLDANGNILPNAPAAAAQIWSNAELNPQNSEGLGTYYLVTLYDQNGAILNSVPMWWQFSQANGATVNISEMTAFMTEGNVIYYPTIGTGGGTVTSVAFVGDGTILSTTPSTPVTSTGNIIATLLTQTANTVLAGPTSGPAAAPTFRALVAADIPSGYIWSNLGAAAANLILANTTFSTTWENTTSAAGYLFSNISAATSGGNFSSPSVSIAGTLWTGAASAADTWSLQNVIGAGSNPTTTLAITHTAGGTGVASISAPPISVSVTWNAAAQATFRAVDVEPSLSYAGSTTITGSVVGVRGNITQVSTNTVAGGFVYGVQGKLTLAGTLNNGSGFNYGIFGQVDTSAASFIHTSGYFGPIGADFGATSIMATDANANMITLLNTTNCIINAALLFTGNASYLFDVNDEAFGGAHFVQPTSVNTGDLANVKLKVHVGGSVYYLPLYTA